MSLTTSPSCSSSPPSSPLPSLPLPFGRVVLALSALLPENYELVLPPEGSELSLPLPLARELAATLSWTSSIMTVVVRSPDGSRREARFYAPAGLLYCDFRDPAGWISPRQRTYPGEEEPVLRLFLDLPHPS